MRRHRFAILVLLLFAVLILQSALMSAEPQKATSKKWVPKVDPKTRIIRNLPFETIITKRLLATKLLFPCLKKDKEEQPPAEPIGQTGGFVCTTVHDIELSVSGGTLTVLPRSLRVKQGSCVQWRVTPDDATIDVIDFIDTAAEATVKSKTFQEVGDQCQSSKRCVMYMAAPQGTYPYNAVVIHGGTPKKVDPEVIIVCSGCGEM